MAKALDSNQKDVGELMKEVYEFYELLTFDDKYVTCPVEGCNIIGGKATIKWHREGDTLIGKLPPPEWRKEQLRTLKEVHDKGIHTNPTDFQRYGLAYKVTIPGW